MEEDPPDEEEPLLEDDPLPVFEELDDELEDVEPLLLLVEVVEVLLAAAAAASFSSTHVSCDSLTRIHRCRFEAGDFSGAVTSALSGHVGTSGP